MKKENMCQICNGTYSIDDLEGDSHQHLIIGDSLFHWDSTLGYEGQIVNYCFSCGRKLVAENCNINKSSVCFGATDEKSDEATIFTGEIYKDSFDVFPMKREKYRFTTNGFSIDNGKSKITIGPCLGKEMAKDVCEDGDSMYLGDRSRAPFVNILSPTTYYMDSVFLKRGNMEMVADVNPPRPSYK